MSITVSGTVRKVGEVETIGASNFRKRLIVLDDNSGQYPAVYAVEFVQDKTDLLNGIFEGSDVEINVNIRVTRFLIDSLLRCRDGRLVLSN